MTDLELLKYVYEDLSFINEKWTSNIDQKDIRITGAILRRLLCEDNLQKAFNELDQSNQSIVFEVVDVDKILKNFATDDIEFFIAGGAEYNGVWLQAALLKKDSRRFLKTPMVMVPLKKFKIYTCLQMKEHMGAKSAGLPVKHIKINNLELIRYFCNKLGAVHYDKSRGDKTIDYKFKQLDRLRKNKNWLTINFNGLDVIYFQYLSIGQIINTSNDVKAFISKLKLILKI